MPSAHDGKDAAESIRIGSESISGEGIREDLVGDGLCLFPIEGSRSSQFTETMRRVSWHCIFV